MQLKARLTRGADRIARQGTRFWVVGPQVGLSGVSNLSTLVSGPYIEVLPAPKAGQAQTSFSLLGGEAPNLLGRENGLRLTLSAPRRGSLKAGVPVTYREVPVGKVTSIEPWANRPTGC